MLKSAIESAPDEVQSAKQILSNLESEIVDLQDRLTAKKTLRQLLQARVEELPSRRKEQPKAKPARKVIETGKGEKEGGLKKKVSPKDKPEKPFDHRGVCESIARELAPEFDSHQFRQVCLTRYPDRANEFTMMKVKKRLNRMAGFENSIITLAAKGVGRRPPKYHVKQTS